ncbi:MobP3 family relaxase [Ruminiclostridium cellobioparum]|nr:MobP3 family relaxase [Ruminiclostridium cellobioparum]
MYKQRFKPVNLKSTPNKNAGHIRYIGTRPGVMKNEGERHGLFGNIYDKNSLEINHKIKDVIELVRQKSNEKKNIFRSVISFLPDNAAIKLGDPITKEAWQELVKQNIEIIAKDNNISLSNMRWVAAAHDTPNHPHVHIAFWDESQEIQKNFVHPKIPAGIRTKLIKNIFEDELREYYENKKQAEIRMKDVTSEMTNEFEAYLSGLTSDEYSKLIKEGYEINENPDEHMCEYLAEKLFEIRKEIPKGSLKFEYLRPDIKEKLIHLVRELVDMNDGLQEVIQELVQSRIDIAKMYNSDEIHLDSLYDQYEKEAEKTIANKLLQLVKKFNEKDWEIKSEEFNRQIRMQQTERLITDIFASLARLTKQSRKDYISRKKVIGGELSKQARKEKAKELESTGWDIEK